MSRHSTTSLAVRFSSFHALTSSVIYYSTHARQNEIYLLSKMQIGIYASDVDAKQFLATILNECYKTSVWLGNDLHCELSLKDVP